MLKVNTLLFFRALGVLSAANQGDRVVFSEAATIDELPDWYAENSPYLKTYYDRTMLGHRAVVGKYEGTPAHVSWVAVGALGVDELGAEWRLSSNEACIYDVVTLEDFRGKGIYPSALCWIHNRLIGEGKSATWIYCEKENESSRRGIEKAGFVFVGQATALMFRNKRIRLSGRIPGVSLK